MTESNLLRYTHFMLDIETMGNTPDAPITSVSVVPFNPDSGLIIAKDRCFHMHVDLQDQFDLGMKPTASTILWWMGQSEEARRRLTEGQKTAGSTRFVMGRVAEFIEQFADRKEARIWGNGAAFDQPIIEGSFRAVGQEFAWMFYNHRCFRTLKTLRPDLCSFHAEVAHDALDDAYAQAMNAIYIIQALPVVAANV